MFPRLSPETLGWPLKIIMKRRKRGEKKKKKNSCDLAIFRYFSNSLIFHGIVFNHWIFIFVTRYRNFREQTGSDKRNENFHPLRPENRIFRPVFRPDSSNIHEGEGGREEIVRTKIVINFAISRTRRFLFIRRTRGRIRNENWAGDFDIVVEAYRYENVSPKLSTVFRANLERA